MPKLRAAQGCDCCHRCERPIALGEPVWRVRVGKGYGFSGRWSTRIVLWCSQCGERGGYEGIEVDFCEVCERMVVNTELRPRTRCFCCGRCTADFYAARQRERRRAGRHQRACASCGESFSPTRTDARYCCGACRQRGYRRRKSRRAAAREADAPASAGKPG